MSLYVSRNISERTADMAFAISACEGQRSAISSVMSSSIRPAIAYATTSGGEAR